jgi:hypothetical protein
MAEISFEVGDKVKHFKWGVGTVLQKVGAGDRVKVNVMFPDVGAKLLMVQFAKLEKIASAPKRKPVEEVIEVVPVVDIPSDDAEIIPAIAEDVVPDDEVAEIGFDTIAETEDEEEEDDTL